MPEIANFKLEFIKEEQHLMLPTVTSIKLTQDLYDVLFQYLVTEEQEVLLKRFIDMMESHIKSKARAPFSRPVEELEFLDEGLQELRMLNWMEVPVAVFKLVLDENIAAEDSDPAVEGITDLLERIAVFSQPDDGDLIWIYPYLMVR